MAQNPNQPPSYKTHGLEGKKPDKEIPHWFLNDKIIALERRIVNLEQESEKLLKDWEELKIVAEKMLCDWSDK